MCEEAGQRRRARAAAPAAQIKEQEQEQEQKQKQKQKQRQQQQNKNKNKKQKQNHGREMSGEPCQGDVGGTLGGRCPGNLGKFPQMSGEPREVPPILFLKDL